MVVPAPEVSRELSRALPPYLAPLVTERQRPVRCTAPNAFSPQQGGHCRVCQGCRYEELAIDLPERIHIRPERPFASPPLLHTIFRRSGGEL
jgi:hypothetical protein